LRAEINSNHLLLYTYREFVIIQVGSGSHRFQITHTEFLSLLLTANPPKNPQTKKMTREV